MPVLHWLGKEAAVTAQETIPFRLLDPLETVGETPHENLLIHGDNLEALKALLPYYAGKVKCVFIDPPYNTKKDFGHYEDNLEHSKWLGTMVSRLTLLRDLLAEDGCIMVTLDDNEAHYFKVLADEVFGRKNYVCEVTE
jgi:adenine-specific DNA-methyltransferase